MRCRVMLYSYMFKFLYALHTLSRYALLICVQVPLFLHIVHVVACALLTCVCSSSPPHIVHVVSCTLLICVCAFIALLCLFQIALLCAHSGCVVMHPFHLHCHAHSHSRCHALFTCIAMHVSNIIVPVKFSFFFRLDIVCTVHLRLARLEEPDRNDIVCTVHLKLARPDEPHRYCRLRVKRSENYIILLHPFCIVM